MEMDEHGERRHLTIQLHRILVFLDDESTPMSFIDERLERLIRKREQVTIISTHDLRIDLTESKVYRAGRLIRLTPKELGILLYLGQRIGTSVSKDELLREVWGYNGNVITNTVETHMYRLRIKIDRGHDVKLLINNPAGRGHLLKGDRPSY